MGQKVNPTGIRLGITETWKSMWFAHSEYADYLNADLKVRDYLMKKLAGASVSRIQIDRPARNAKIAIHAARPGVIIGKKGSDVDILDELKKTQSTIDAMNEPSDKAEIIFRDLMVLLEIIIDENNGNPNQQ